MPRVLAEQVAHRRRLAERAATHEWPSVGRVLFDCDFPPAVADLIAANTPQDTLHRCDYADTVIEIHAPTSTDSNDDRRWCQGHGMEAVPWPCHDYRDLAASWGIAVPD